MIQILDDVVKGRVFTVGDIHGCYDLLMKHLERRLFDFDKDLLIAVGDLIDRGNQNLECISLLDQPWFKSVMGNHELMAIQGMQSQPYKRCHMENGGEWFYKLNSDRQLEIVEKLKKLPIAIEAHYQGKKYGFVHAHIEQNNWDTFKNSFADFTECGKLIAGRTPYDLAMWARDRLDHTKHQYKHVEGIDAVILGHTVVINPVKRDNCYFIDTGAVHLGTMTLFELLSINHPNN